MPSLPNKMSRGAYEFARLLQWVPAQGETVDTIAPWLRKLILARDIPDIVKAAGSSRETVSADDTIIADELSGAFFCAYSFRRTIAELSVPPAELRKFAENTAEGAKQLLDTLGHHDSNSNFDSTAELRRLLSAGSTIPAHNLEFLNKALPERLRATLLEISTPSAVGVPSARKLAISLLQIAPVVLEVLRLHADALATAISEYPKLSPGNQSNHFSKVLYYGLASAWLTYFGGATLIAKSGQQKQDENYPSNSWLNAIFKAALKNMPDKCSLTDADKPICHVIELESKKSQFTKANALYIGLRELQTGIRFEEKRNRK